LNEEKLRLINFSDKILFNICCIMYM